jgi:hypothetical protein
MHKENTEKAMKAEKAIRLLMLAEHNIGDFICQEEIRDNIIEMHTNLCHLTTLYEFDMDEIRNEVIYSYNAHVSEPVKQERENAADSSKDDVRYYSFLEALQLHQAYEDVLGMFDENTGSKLYWRDGQFYELNSDTPTLVSADELFSHKWRLVVVR